MPKILRDEFGKVKYYECSICGHYLSTKDEASRCERSCNEMIEAYMEIEKISFKEAKKMFLMECI
jgi:hypothetical protein